MRGNMELIGSDGQVLGEGRVGEWLFVEHAGKAHTLAIDAGAELVLQRMEPGQPHSMLVNEQALQALLQ